MIDESKARIAYENLRDEETAHGADFSTIIINMANGKQSISAIADEITKHANEKDIDCPGDCLGRYIEGVATQIAADMRSLTLLTKVRNLL